MKYNLKEEKHKNDSKGGRNWLMPDVKKVTEFKVINEPMQKFSFYTATVNYCRSSYLISDLITIKTLMKLQNKAQVYNFKLR
jgi:hypothetical protein